MRDAERLSYIYSSYTPFDFFFGLVIRRSAIIAADICNTTAEHSSEFDIALIDAVGDDAIKLAFHDPTPTSSRGSYLPTRPTRAVEVIPVAS